MTSNGKSMITSTMKSGASPSPATPEETTMSDERIERVRQMYRRNYNRFPVQDVFVWDDIGLLLECIDELVAVAQAAGGLQFVDKVFKHALNVDKWMYVNTRTLQHLQESLAKLDTGQGETGVNVI